jgi:polar amino acid transport system substrate-binding protein
MHAIHRHLPQRGLWIVALAVAAVPLLAATAWAAEQQVAPPPAIAKAGKLVFCSDITYPPEEFIQHGKQTGAEIQLGQQLAKQMGVKAEFDQTGFNGIIPSLLANKCDAILSGMGITAARAKQVYFVPYVIAGQAIMIQKKDRSKIHGLKDLSGRLVAVQVGTTNKDYLDGIDKNWAKQGIKPMKLAIFPADRDAANALRSGKVDAYFSDAPPVAYYVKTGNGQFLQAGPQLSPVPWGIAIARSNKALQTAMRLAVYEVYHHGTMKTILAQWNLSDTLLRLAQVKK